MAQQIITVCDECLMAGTEAGAETWAVTVTVPGGKPVAYAVDVCAVHAKPYADMAAHLADVGHRTGRRGAPTARQTRQEAPRAAVETADALTCPACGHVTPSPAGLATHARTKHDRSLAELRGEAPYACPVEGCPRAAGAVPGLSAHLRATHGYSSDDAREAVAAVVAAAP